MHGGEATGGIIDFLSESSRSFGRINLFDVTSAATGTTYKFTGVPSTSIWQFFPMLKFPFVLCVRRHCAMRLPHDLRLTHSTSSEQAPPPLQLWTTTLGAALAFLVSEETAAADDLGNLRGHHLVPAFVPGGDALEDVP